jgi:hypothetical protein
MQTELERMRSTAAVVSATSTTISSINTQYSTYQERISSAARTLRHLKNKIESDDRYIYWSYLVFMASALWIFLKRVKIVAITEWLARAGLSGFSSIASMGSITVETSPTREATPVVPVPSVRTTGRPPSATIYTTTSTPTAGFPGVTTTYFTTTSPAAITAGVTVPLLEEGTSLPTGEASDATSTTTTTLTPVTIREEVSTTSQAMEEGGIAEAEPSGEL